MIFSTIFSIVNGIITAHYYKEEKDGNFKSQAVLLVLFVSLMVVSWTTNMLALNLTNYITNFQFINVMLAYPLTCVAAYYIQKGIHERNMWLDTVREINCGTMVIFNICSGPFNRIRKKWILFTGASAFGYLSSVTFIELIF